MEFIIISVLSLLIAVWGVSWLLKSLRIGGGSNASIVSAKRRLKGVGVIALIALFVIGLIDHYVTPAVVTAFVATGDWISGAANSVADGTVTAANGFVSGLPIIIGIVLALGYWTGASMWIGKPAHRRDRDLRSIGVGAVFLALFIGYMWLFIA